MKQKIIDIIVKLSNNVEKFFDKFDKDNLLYLFIFGWFVAIPTSFIAAVITFAVLVFCLMIKEKITFQELKNNNTRFALIGGFISLVIRLL